MQKYSSNITDAQGNAFAFATVTVTDENGALAVLYKANDITKPLANPLTTDALSNFSFYAANGRYSWNASGTGFSAGGVTDFVLYDAMDDTYRAPRPITQATPPLEPVENMGWINATNGKYYLYLKDASDDFQWVESYSADAAQSASVMEQLGAPGGSSLVTFTQAGAGAESQTVEAVLRERISINAYGALPSASAAVNAAAIKAAILACPSGGMVVAGVGGTYTVSSDAALPVTLNKRMIFDGAGAVFRHDGTSTGTLFRLGKDGSTPAADCNFNGQLEYLELRNLTLQGALIPNGAVDNRTSLCDAIVLDGGTDALRLTNVSAEGFKAAGLKFSGNGSVRESHFDDVTLRYCGTSTVAAYDVVNVATGGDPHNEIYHDKLRIIYSGGRDIHVTAHASGPNAAGWPRLWYFSNFQLENESAASNFWNTAPDVEKVWVEGGSGFFFSNGNSLNSYGTDSSKWGRPHMRFGNKASGYAVESVSFDGIHYQNSGAAGVGVLLENVGVRKSAGCTFQFANPVTQKRAEVLAAIVPTDAYGTASTPGTRTFMFNDMSSDSGLGTFFLDDSYRAYVVGRHGRTSASGITTQVQNAGGFISGGYTQPVPAGGGTYTIDLLNLLPLGSLREDLTKSYWIVNADVAFYGTPFSAAGIAAGVKCLFDKNLVPPVSSLGSASQGNLAISAATIGGAAAGSLVGDACGKLQIVVTNTTGSAVNVVIAATRFGD